MTTTAIAAVLLGACARPTQFDRYLSNQQWADAAREFESDSLLRNDEHALYRGAVLFGTPGRPIYDPVKARELFTMLLARFPATTHRNEATAHLLLLDATLRTQHDAAERERDLEARIAALTRESNDLRARVDSIAAQGDSLRAVVARLDADRRDREEQLRALRLELQKLKEIDLKPKRPP